MTTTPGQRPARPQPPVSSREAALVGALTAFAKSAAASKAPTGPTVATRPLPIPGKKPQIVALPASTRSVAGAKHPSSSGKIQESAPVRPTRYDSGTSSTVTKRGSSERLQGAAQAEETQAPRQKSSAPGAQKPGRPAAGDAAAASEERADNVAPPPSAASLIRMFETRRNSSATSSEERRAPARAISGALATRRLASSTATPPPISSKPPASVIVGPISARSDKTEKTDLSSPASFISAKDFQSPLRDHDPEVAVVASDVKPAASATTPINIPQRLAVPPRRESEDTQRSVSPFEPAGYFSNQNLHPGRPTLFSLPAAASSTTSITATYNALYPRRHSTLSTDDALANAIVASSLASSRAVSPMPHLHAPIPKHHHHHHHLFARTPSPPKPSTPGPTVLRATLRPTRPDSPSSAEDDPYAKHKRKRHLHKHANKYAEGDRKRWRNAVSPRERARYEGVWAANKGFFCPASEADSVHALAVKELWARSRLPAHVLQEIWGLVAREDVPLLSREEFVVGMWLVDQRLKGRKLPVRVGGSVWESVRVVVGIRIRHREIGKGW